MPSTCTYPLSQSSEPRSGDLCPNPPRLSYEDANRTVTGKLDSNLVYVDEYLIRKAEDLDPEIYIQRLLGGFVLSHQEPAFGSCESISTRVEEAANKVFTRCRQIEGSEYYTANLTEGTWLNRLDNCPALAANTTGSGSDAGPDADSLVDGTSVDLFRGVLCGEKDIGGSASTSLPIFTPNPSTSKIEATVYYNNNVSYFRTECACLSVMLSVDFYGVTYFSHGPQPDCFFV